MNIQLLSSTKAPVKKQRRFFKPKRIALFSLFFFSVLFSVAQAPTSLQYPSSNGFIANVTNVYLVPTLAGSTSGLGYSISPSLPAGLSFNTGTGVISGVATAASNATTYTVTATNSSGSTTCNFTITVTNSFFDNALGQVKFTDASRTFKVGNGQSAGDIALYSNVVTIAGQAIDCIVKTVSATNVSSWDAYDQKLASGTYFNSNDDKFFSPQFNFSAAGSAIFDFQFIIGGSYNNATNTGTDVTLQNVVLNSYDIDGNNGASSNQYNEFAGFSKSELGSSTTISAPAYDATLGLTKFTSGTNANNTTVTADATRVRLTYNNMSSFRIEVGAGAGGLAYFFFDFSTGPTFSTATPSFPPSIDLNTTLSGTGNGASGCATALSFSKSAQTNVAASTALNELKVTYENTSANLPDGASEKLVINGFTAGTGAHALNFSTSSSSSVTVGGVAYTITKSVLGTTNTIAFTTGTTFSLSDAETLVDALQFSNTASSPTSGDRNFTVNVRNTQYISPDADFTATLNCVTVSGYIYHDANGLTDNTVNANSTTGQFPAAGAYAVLTNASTNAVISTVPITAGGAYTFGKQDPGTYNIFISSTSSPGATLTASTFPSGNYKSIGENLGASAGNDGLIDSKMTISLGTIAATNANFGIQIPPVTADYTSGNQSNPGGFNYYSVPSSNFDATDADGTVQSVTITSFPSGANYLKVGSTLYTNGGTCPPQSSCTAWPGTLVVPIANIGTLSVDPSGTGNTSVTIQFTALDNGSFVSNGNTPSTITLPFTVPLSPLVVSGTVWNDANGDGVKDAGESYSAAASSGQTLYAILVQNTNTYSGLPTIYASTAVSASTGYSFNSVPAGNDYEVRLASLASAPTDGAAATTVSPALATGYTGVSTNNGAASANLNTNNLINSLGTVNGDKTSIGFGLDRSPTTSAISTGIYAPPVNSFKTLSGGSNPPIFIGSDPEDQPVTGTLSGKTVAITALPANGQLWYNGTQITKGADGTNPPSASNPLTINNFDPTKIQAKFTGSGYFSFSFSYAYVDAAGIMDLAPATYALNWSTPLPVHLTSFVGNVSGTIAKLAWTSVDEVNFKEYVLERSIDGISYAPVATIAAKGAASNSYSHVDNLQNVTVTKVYYRLKQVDNDGGFSYSNTVFVSLVKESSFNVSVSPNPVRSNLSVAINNNHDGKAILRITDYTGKTVLAKTVTLIAGTTTVSVENEKRLVNGAYLLSVEVDGKMTTQQFVVQR